MLLKDYTGCASLSSAPAAALEVHTSKSCSKQHAHNTRISDSEARQASVDGYVTLLRMSVLSDGMTEATESVYVVTGEQLALV